MAQIQVHLFELNESAVFRTGQSRFGSGGRAELYSQLLQVPIGRHMLWFFARQDAHLHYEIRKQTDCEDYEIVITHPDGRQEVEQYSDTGGLLQRSADLENALRSDGWQPLG